MSKFYTVTINRLQLVSKFNEHGVKISDVVMKIPVVHNDLPYATALMYQQKGAPGEVTIVEQFQEFAPGRARKVADYLASAAAGEQHRTKTKYLKHIGSEDLRESEVGAAISGEPIPDRDVLEAARSGDMSAAISAEMEDAT